MKKTLRAIIGALLLLFGAFFMYAAVDLWLHNHFRLGFGAFFGCAAFATAGLMAVPQEAWRDIAAFFTNFWY